MLTTDTRSVAWSIVLGVLLLVAGVIAIALPLFAGIAASILFGWLLMVAGIVHLVYAWSERGAGAIVWQILIGVAYLIAALYMLVLPVAGVITLTLVLTFYIVLTGILELAVFFRLRWLRGAIWFLVDVTDCRSHLLPLAIQCVVGRRHIGGGQLVAERHCKDYFTAESARDPRLAKDERSPV